MTDRWCDRAFTTLEAADIAGITANNLAVIIHRHGADGWSAKRRGRRWFAPCDIAVLRTALALAHAMPMGAALIVALAHHRAQPGADVFLVAADGEVMPADANAAARMAVERGAVVVPVGRIAAETDAACAAIYES